MTQILSLAIDLYFFALLGTVIVSWVAPHSDHPVVAFLHRITEPVLAPIRKVLPSAGGLDFSPLVVMLGLQLLKRLLH